jgi:hypothetical protein
VLFGPLRDDANGKLHDLTGIEYATLLPLLALIVWIGVYPQPFLRTTQATVKQLLTQVQRTALSDQPSAGSFGGTGAGQNGTSIHGAVGGSADPGHEPSAMSHEPAVPAATAAGTAEGISRGY